MEKTHKGVAMIIKRIIVEFLASMECEGMEQSAAQSG